jgi:tetratricopeptide (TPR) repeat protein
MEDNVAYLDAYIQFIFRDEDLNDPAQTISVLEHLALVRPREPRVFYYLGIMHNYMKDYGKAVAAFEKTIEAAGDSEEHRELLSAQFYFWYAAACERGGDFKKAEKLFRKCVSLNEEYAEAYNYLAYMWAEQGTNLEEALEWVNKALALEPESGAYLDTLGWIYYQQGKYDAALAEVEKAVAYIPDDPTILDHLGDILFKLGGVDRALPQWRRSFVLDPENEVVGEKLTDHGVDLAPLRIEAEELEEEEQTDEEAPAIEAVPGPVQKQPKPDEVEKPEVLNGGEEVDWPASTEPAGPVIQGVPVDVKPLETPVPRDDPLEPIIVPEPATP